MSSGERLRMHPIPSSTPLNLSLAAVSPHLPPGRARSERTDSLGCSYSPLAGPDRFRSVSYRDHERLRGTEAVDIVSYIHNSTGRCPQEFLAERERINGRWPHAAAQSRHKAHRILENKSHRAVPLPVKHRFSLPSAVESEHWGRATIDGGDGNTLVECHGEFNHVSEFIGRDAGCQ